METTAHLSSSGRAAHSVIAFEFSVIGDSVNVAARVESATRQTGDPILVSGRTKELLSDTSKKFVERTGLTLKGKTEPVRIFAPRSVLMSPSSSDHTTDEIRAPSNTESVPMT